MSHLDIQTAYWDRVAFQKTFSHPIPLSLFRDALPLTARILDYGCGYGRACSALADAGYSDITGIDISSEMVRRGKEMDGRGDLRTIDGIATGFDEGSFDLYLLVTVLTCIPSDEGQKLIVREIHRLLRPRGFLFVSDMPLQADARNRQRYREFEKEFGTFGVFRTEDAVVRHHDMKWVHQLLSGFSVVRENTVRITTMNGHEADAFQGNGSKGRESLTRSRHPRTMDGGYAAASLSERRPAGTREVECRFLNAVHVDEAVHLIIEERANCADAEVGRRRCKVKVLGDVTGIYVDVPVGPLPVLPRAPRNDGCPYEGSLGVPDHFLSKGGLGQMGGNIAAFDKLQVEHVRPEMVYALLEPLDLPCEEIGLDRV
jgi:SAM-dependent methyltransferase